MIDLDANATTMLLPEALDAMLPWLREQHANPSGSYQAAKRARQAIEQAREQVAELLDASAEEIVFTSGGTESVNAALQSMHRLTSLDGKALTSAIEHSAVLRSLESMPREVKALPVDAEGRLELSPLEESLQDAAFLSLMAANNETGVLQPLGEALSMAAQAGIPVHSDATQAIGKHPFSTKEHPLHMASLSAHKFHGPKGVGALYIRKSLKFKPLLHGGGQEAGRRSGTENTAAIVGMGVAAEAARRELANGLEQQLSTLRNAFEETILQSLDGVHCNGSREARLTNTSHLSFDGCDASGLLILLDEADIQCSAGSACMTGKQQPSHVQIAMGIPESQAKSSLRFCFSRMNAPQDAMDAAQAVIQAVKKLRGIQGSGTGPVVVYSP